MSDPPREEHRERREQLGVYALGHGTATERAAVRAHLDGCAACRAELAELAPLAARLAGIDPDRLDETPAPPPELRDAVLARIAAEDRARPVRPTARRRVAVLVTGGVVGIATAALGVGWLVRPVPEPVPSEPVAVEVTDADIEATADLVAHTWGVEVKLSGEGFTAGEVYRVTVIEEDGGVAPAGEFLGVGPAQLNCNLNSSVLREDAVGFSVTGDDGVVVLRSRF